MVTRDHEVTLGVKIQSDLRFSLISLSFYIVDMTMHFSQNIFHLDQFGYKRHAPAFRPKLVLITFFYSDQFWYGKRERAFCTQIDSKNTDSKSQLVYLKLTLDFNIMKVYGFIGQKPSFLFRPK